MQIQQDACAHCTCLNNASMSAVQNCPQMIEEEQLLSPNNSPNLNGMEWRYPVWGATHEAILKPPSEAQNIF